MTDEWRRAPSTQSPPISVPLQAGGTLYGRAWARRVYWGVFEVTGVTVEADVIAGTCSAVGRVVVTGTVGHAAVPGARCTRSRSRSGADHSADVATNAAQASATTGPAIDIGAGAVVGAHPWSGIAKPIS